ncbi:MAG: PEP-CTERM sorting domain-containing protein [Chthonomonadales bacterium]
MKLSRSIVMCALMAAGMFAMSNARVIAQELVQNGGFELNGGAGISSLTNWNIVNYGTGTKWYAQTGNNSPISNTFGVPPPGGSFAAMSDQLNGVPGTTILYQDFAVPLNVSSAAVSFDRWIDNDYFPSDGPAFFNPGTLDYSVQDNNQQARFDIVTTSADLLSLAGGDVLFNLYFTQGFDQTTQGYDTYVNDMTGFLQSHAGETLRIRLAEVNNVCDNQGCYGLRFGADNVSFTYEQQAAVPEPSMLILMTGGIGVGAVWIRRRRRG